jgi:cation:H+ antiporter
MQSCPALRPARRLGRRFPRVRIGEGGKEAAVSLLLLAVSFAVLLGGALLFTNGVEWLGHRLGLGEGAVGSLLAAVATALPESIIPVVAIAAGGSAGDVAIGAIVGAPFMLATIAMALVGFSAIAFRGRRPQRGCIDADAGTLARDLRFFLLFFAAGLLLGLGAPREVQVAAAVVFVLAYGVYVRATLRGGSPVQEAETLKPLLLPLGRRSPRLPAILLQLALALGAIVGGAHLFVHELLAVAEDVGVEPLVLSLVLAPLATELPEKANSFIWMREAKDSLALGNITGAMVFQSTLPVALGLAFTSWSLTGPSVVAIVAGLLGGAVAVWALTARRRFELPAIGVWLVLYAAFVLYVSAL